MKRTYVKATGSTTTHEQTISKFIPNKYSLVGMIQTFESSKIRLVSIGFQQN